MKGFQKRYMVQNIWERIAENLDFVKSSNFIRGSTKAAVGVCHGVNRRRTYSSNYDRTVPLVFSCEITFLQNPSGRLLLEVVTENILKNSNSENYLNLSQNKE